jgi:phosphotransferase family enzyme
MSEGHPLARLTRAAFGAGHRLVSVSRLPGSSKKGVYRAIFDGGFSAIVYVWDSSEDYWPDAEQAAADHDYADPFSHASGLELFLAANTRLSELGIRTPTLHLADASREHYPADVAVVEDVPGPSLEEVLHTEPGRAEPIMRQLGEALHVLHADKSDRFGKLVHISKGGVSRGSSCEQVILTRALANLAEAAARVPEVGQVSADLESTLRGHASRIGPRTDYRLIHGELGPDHVLVDSAGRPVLADIEGLMYFDREWEHVFLRLRFGETYRFLQVPGLDQPRLDLYRLAMHLSLIAGPLRLLDGDYPDREPMLDIVAYNIDQALSLSQEA